MLPPRLAKRSLSEGPSSDGVVRSPHVDDLSTETCKLDIDTYMAEQGLKWTFLTPRFNCPHMPQTE